MPETTAKVYVIDDDDSVRVAIQRLIRSAGYPVEVFASAQDFLDCEHRTDRSCIVLDVHLPVMNGLDLQRRLNSEGCITPIIFITAHDDAQTNAAALDGGAKYFLSKPIDDQELLRAIEVSIGQGL